ncbi:MAG TPA: four helix bundle protein, partial [Verrucomicrobiae bacterium]|nr:four helix bundle protein [Verrucomicrobiae bacterium]
MKPMDLSDRLWKFAARVAKVVDALPHTRSGRHVAAQLIRCGTAAPPNYDEGRVAESRADFAHKVNVALKELVESEGWLKFIAIASLLSESKIHAIRDECSQLCKILTASVATARGRRKRRRNRSKEKSTEQEAQAPDDGIAANLAHETQRPKQPVA